MNDNLNEDKTNLNEDNSPEQNSFPSVYLNNFLGTTKTKSKKSSPEKNFRVSLKKKLEQLGCMVISTTMKSKINGQFISPIAPGTADLVVCTPKGKYFEIETKTNSGKPTPSQLKRKQIFEKKGLSNHYLFCSPKNEKDVVSMIMSS